MHLTDLIRTGHSFHCPYDLREIISMNIIVVKQLRKEKLNNEMKHTRC